MEVFLMSQQSWTSGVLPATHLIVGVVKVHRLTKSHFSFGLQVVQLDRPWELQDPSERERERIKKTVSATETFNRNSVVKPFKASPLFSFELKLHSDVILLERWLQTQK